MRTHMPTQYTVPAPHDAKAAFWLWFLPAQLTSTPSSGNKILHLYLKDLSSPLERTLVVTLATGMSPDSGWVIVVPHHHPYRDHAEMGL